MTTTLDPPVVDDSTVAPPASGSPDPEGLREIENRLDRHSTRRDNWTILMFATAVAALIFSVIAVGFGLRAIDQSKLRARTAAPAAPAPAPPAPVALTSVTLGDMTVTPSATVVPPGQYTVNVVNSGKIAHELLVFHTDLAPGSLVVGPDGKVGEDAPGFMISDGDNLDPGASQSRVIDLRVPGTYMFVCNLPGHFMAGMHTTVTVK